MLIACCVFVAGAIFGGIRWSANATERGALGSTTTYVHLLSLYAVGICTELDAQVDFVGDPRDYKWITVSPIPLSRRVPYTDATGRAHLQYIQQSSQIERTFEQMSTAVARAATKIWILNVGDLKPYELHTEFFLAYAYDAPRWGPRNLQDFVAAWARREFALAAEEDARTVAGIVANVTRHNARRKPELWNATTYSLTNYRECVFVWIRVRSRALWTEVMGG